MTNKKSKTLENYSHEGEKRKNNPPVGLVSSSTDRLNGRTKYAHDPHIDPYLSWSGKKEGTEFEVQNVSLHIHERIDPKRIIKSFLKKDTGPKQTSFFEQPENEPPLHKAIDFYRHEQDWTNRLIAGDSLLVMNSLLDKEGMGGKVQMVYIDPPYGVKYKSNFQPFLNKKNVQDKDDDIPAEPEMIQAFRDTWELGIHSYLSHLRDRLLLAKELLHESGSVFVQISDENLHHVREVMAEVFGAQNFVRIIPFRKKTMPLGGVVLEEMFDYLVWYCLDLKKIKYRQLYERMNTEGLSYWNYVKLPNGTIRKMAKDEINNHSMLPKKSRVARGVSLKPPSFSASNVFDFELDGVVHKPPGCWTTNKKGMVLLAEQDRLIVAGKTLNYLLFEDDFPYSKLTNNWSDTTGAQNKLYVVQTSDRVIQRCLLMTTDPGDLVFDPTCGSGTTAWVAEKWGRRWITCDTSRVAVTLAKQRLMTSRFDYYKLAHKEEGIQSGFKLTQSQKRSSRTIISGNEDKVIDLYDQPFVERNKVRVAGPLTVEAVPSLRVKPFDSKEPKVKGTGKELALTGETGNQTLWRDELKATGIRTIGGKLIKFSRVEPMTATRFLHAEGEMLDEDGENKKAHISFGPDYGPLEQRQVEEAIKEARSLKEEPNFVIFAAFHFDPEAAKDIDQIDWPGVTILKSQMSVDLLTLDLRKKRSSSQSYWLVGQPDVEIKKQEDGKYVVLVHGFDYYNPITGEIESKSSQHIAMWFLDTDYDERSLLPEQVFFPMKDSKRDWTKLAKALNSDVDEEKLEMFSGTESLPFEAGDEKKIAVKIIDNRGIESFVIKALD